MLPDFNRLRVFYHVYAQRSVVSAARELSVTQSAVSQQLQKLESEMGAPLFTRLHKRLIPTLAGERLYGLVQPFVTRLADGVQDIRRGRSGVFGLLRVGAPVEFGKRYLPGLFAAFRREHPDVRFSLVLGHPTELLPKLTDGRLDLAFTDLFGGGRDLPREAALYSIESVMRETLILVCSRRYYRKHVRGEHTYPCLAGVDYLCYDEQAPAVKGWFKHHFRRIPPTLNVVLSVESVQGIVAGLAHDMGLGIVPSHFVAAELKRHRFVKIATRRKALTNRISLVQLLDKVPGPAEKAFVQYARGAMQKADAEGAT